LEVVNCGSHRLRRRRHSDLELPSHRNWTLKAMLVAFHGISVVVLERFGSGELRTFGGSNHRRVESLSSFAREVCGWQGNMNRS
jgi:hypothetical protein